MNRSDLSERVIGSLNQVNNPNRWTFLTTSHGNLDEVNDPDWVFRSAHRNWAHIFKYGWWKGWDELENRIDSGGADVRIGFAHKLKGNRNLALQDRILKFYFRNMGGNEQKFIDDFCDCFYARESEIDSYLPRSAEITGNKGNMIESTYDIQIEDHDDFFEAYIAALRRAFVDHVLENKKLVSKIDSVYEESIDNIYR